MTEQKSVEELLKKLDVARREVQEFKEKVAAANKKKEAAFQKKQEVSKQISGKIEHLLGGKKVRNELTSDVQELKKERDKLNQQIKEKVAEIKEMHSKSSTTDFDKKNNPALLKKQIEKIEFRLETQPMGFDAEQKLTKQLKEFKKRYASVKDKAEGMIALRQKSKEIDKLKKEANKYHRQVQERAQESQQKHEKLLGSSDEIDSLKKEEDDRYQDFLKEKEKYTEINQQLKEKVAQLQTIKEELNKNNVKVQDTQRQEDLKTLQERAKDAEQKVKDKKKLTTEDLLALQGAK